MARKKKVTLKTIADELGLTIQTVSKALRGLPGMSEKTRKEIFETARHLQYVTKEQVQVLANESIHRFPVYRKRFSLILSQTSLNNLLLMEGLHQRFMEFGHVVDLIMIPKFKSDADIVIWLEEKGLLYSEGIFLGPRVEGKHVESKLLSLPVPKILLNYPPPELKADSVIWDVDEAIHQSVRHLFRMGHHRIMYVGDVESQRGFALRWQSFQAAIKERGKLVHAGDHCLSRGGDGKVDLNEFLRIFRASKPTAVLCGLDEDVSSVFLTCQREVGSIPEGCSFIGILNEQRMDLPLTTRPLLSIKETGYMAADRMLRRIANPLLPYEHTRIKGNFFIGNTVNKVAPIIF